MSRVVEIEKVRGQVGDQLDEDGNAWTGETKPSVNQLTWRPGKTGLRVKRISQGCRHVPGPDGK
jgi:hypothetical protein